MKIPVLPGSQISFHPDSARFRPAIPLGAAGIGHLLVRPIRPIRPLFAISPCAAAICLFLGLASLVPRNLPAADFNADGKPDILFRNHRTGEDRLWLMNGTTFVSAVGLPPAEVGWKFAATADMDGDGNIDIILRHDVNGSPGGGENVIWFMNGTQFDNGVYIEDSSGLVVVNLDQDWEIAGAGDFDQDTHPDLIWRHRTLGANLYWLMNSSTELSSPFLTPHVFDTDWRMETQSWPDSTWRLDGHNQALDQFPAYLKASLNSAGDAVVLDYRFVSLEATAVTIKRRLLPGTTWTTLTTDAPLGISSGAYTDTTATAGERYEYQAYATDPNGNPVAATGTQYVVAGIRSQELDSLGTVLLFVDETLAPSLGSELAQLEQDLVGAGWNWLRYDVPRHDDTDWSANPPNIDQIRQLISSNYFATMGAPDQVQAALLIGHVPVPYSGCGATDKHNGCGATPSDHRGAWPADAYYGAVADMSWPDGVTCTNCDIPINSNYPQDGKWDVDQLNHLEVGIGRIDFANLSAYPDEIQDLRNYLNKDHAYRQHQLSWQGIAPQNQQKTIAYGQFSLTGSRTTFNQATYEQALPNSWAVVGDAPGRLVVGDFFLQHNKSYLLGFQSGSGLWDRINWNHGFLEHKSADFLVTTNEPVAAFSVLLASYIGDWNGGDNNLLRSMLATSQYNMACLWALGDMWRFDYCGLGGPLAFSSLGMFKSRGAVREETILGDPTLLMYVVAPPLNASGTRNGGSIDLSWRSGDPDTEFLIYRSDSSSGPFERLTAAPVTASPYTDSAPLQGTNVYLVRAIKLEVAGSGSYTNISQGAYVTVE